MTHDDARGKPRVLMCVQQDFILRDFAQSGTLDHLARRYRLLFVTGGKVRDDELARLGIVVSRARSGRIRLWLWNSLGALESIRYWQPIIGKMKAKYYNRKKDNNYRGVLRLLRITHGIGLGRPIATVLRTLLWLTVRSAIHYEGKRPDVILVPSIMRDVVADDVMFWAKRHGIPVAALQANLDTFNVKVSTVRPDYWGVWGDQSWYLAHLVQHFPLSRLFVVGSPRFDNHRQQRMTRQQARATLSIPQDVILILFLGSSAVFDETRALRQVEQAIDSSVLPARSLVLYKPHPKGPARGGTAPFKQTEFRHVRLYQSAAGSIWTPLEEYPMLFEAADAVITPFSTIGFEAANYGLPIIGVGYHAERPQFWADAETVHTKAYFDKKWCLACVKEEEFLAALKRLPDLLDDSTIAEQARGDVRAVVYQDDRSYGERLEAMIERVLNRSEEPMAPAPLLDSVRRVAK